ncbi:hypothetical protein TSUD_231860 [Trifolium subterraneum]|uniref:BSD domain-containing protein n=1 Tax=Trifolium subterraneum TaxID=3900 RepID=A0A2Z6LKX2_TRISU|nr:hypothetical protein TSUD_231860 [Trifolium subterraneum]
MAWFARTIANSLKLDEEEEDEQQTLNNNDPNLKSSQSQSPQSDSSQSESPSPLSPTARGVKEDISELTKSLSRQFWGVASFLAPPPDPDHDPNHDPQTRDSDPNLADEDVIAGIRSDFAEINFELSDAQQEHALAVEHLAPQLAALRMELCPGYMSDGCFWKIYFVLLHPKISKDEAVILSTPQIMEARAMLTQALDRRSKEKKVPELSSISSKEEEQEQHLFVPSNAELESVPLQTAPVEEAPPMVVSNVKMEEHPVKSDVTQPIDKSVVKEVPINPSAEQSASDSTNRFSYEETYEDDADDWLKEEDSSEMVGPSGTTVHTGDDEDVSFSDLEEDDGDVHVSNKKTSGSDSSTKDSRDWVQLGRNSPNSDKDLNSMENRRAGSELSSARNSVSKDSNDWLNVDDIDVI